VVSGLVGSGISGVPASDPPRTATDADVLVLTSSAGTPTGLLAEVTGLVAAQRVLPLGGVGNKVLALLRGDADVALMHLKTSLWDSCATEAVRLRLRHSGRRSE
jgi:3'-phosphoadenosine 5'-phosphosulfate (PAPS) 3'-phosphatase